MTIANVPNNPQLYVGALLSTSAKTKIIEMMHQTMFTKLTIIQKISNFEFPEKQKNDFITSLG